MVATRSQDARRKRWDVDAKDVKNMASVEDADDIKGTVQQWIFRFGKDQYVILGVKALIQDIFWLMDPVLLPIAEAYTKLQAPRMRGLPHRGTTPEHSSDYDTILARWQANPKMAPEPHRSICVSHFGHQAGHEIASLQGDDILYHMLAFLFQPDNSTHVSRISDDIGNHMIGPPAAVLNRNSKILQGYKSGGTTLSDVKAPPHAKGPWSFFGTLDDYRWEKVKHWTLNTSDYETLRRIGIKTVMFRGGDNTQRLFAQELTLLRAVYTAVENATPLISAPYDAYVEEDMEPLIMPSHHLSAVDIPVANYDEEQQELQPDPDLLIIEHPSPSLIKGRPVHIGSAPKHLTLSEKKDLAARYRSRRRRSQIERLKRARLETHERRVTAELARKAPAGRTLPGRVLRAGLGKVGGLLYGRQGKKGQGGRVRKVEVVKGREPNVAVGVRAELKSPVMQKRVSEVVLSSDPESE